MQGGYGKAKTALAALMLLFLGFTVTGISGWYGDALTALLSGPLLLIMSMAHVYLISYLPTRRGFRRDSPGSDPDLALLRGEAANARFDHQQIEQLVTGILHPSDVRMRLVEEIEPLRRALKQRVSIALKGAPSGTDTDLLIPILTPLKGELQDGLSIELGGAPVATLTYREFLVLISIALDALFVPANGMSADNIKKLSALADQTLRIVARGRPLNDTDRAEVQKCADDIRAMANTAGESLLVAASLVHKLADNYAIVVVVPPNAATGTPLITYERHLIPGLRLAGLSSPLRWLRDRLSMLLGTRPVQLDLPLANAATARSYHLHVTGPEGMYVGWQNIPDADSLFKRSALGDGLNQAHGQLQRRLGQRYLHLYTRSVPENMANKLHLDVRFFEVPPGSMATATLAAAANFALVYLAALVLMRATTPLGSDFPAIVLAFPAIAGAFAGFESRNTALIGGTLSSRVSSCATIILSLAASGLFMAHTGHSMTLTEHRPILGVVDVWWQLLTVLALVNTSYTLYVWITRTASFYWLAHRAEATEHRPERALGG